MNIWDWIKLNVFEGVAVTVPNSAGVLSGVAAKIIREEHPEIPPTIGEMANHTAISLGKAIEKVFTPIKWLLFGVSAVLILWAFIGRKS
jgi:hypothetical protein